MFRLIPRYGSSANLILSTGNGVNGYTLDPGLGEFILTHPNVRHTLPHLPRLAPLTWVGRCADQDPASGKDLFLQRRKLGLLPSTCDELPQLD